MSNPAKTLCWLVLLLGICPANSRGGWIENGTPLTNQNQWSAAGAATLASDGSSGAILVYRACLGGVNHLLAQRIDSLGSRLWGDEGAELRAATATGAQAVSDGAGGAIVVWMDTRGGGYDIYAQRVDSAGAIQWAPDGVALSAAAGDQEYPRIVSDGAGGAIVAWQDNRGGGYDIYAQRVDAMGAVQWTAGGVSLCAAAGAQRYPRIAVDDAGGAIVTWEDERNGNYDIYAQRVNALGAAVWAENGVALCAAAGNQDELEMASDGAGGAVAVWRDYRGGSADIYAQEVDASGSVPWAADGVAVCTRVGADIDPTVASDGAGGAVVAWCYVCADDGTCMNVYAQRLDASGAQQWGSLGDPICCNSPGYQQFPQAVSDGAGGAIVTWDAQGGSISAQRVNASGGLQWGCYGTMLCGIAGTKDDPVIVSDGVGGAVVAWWDRRSGTTGIYAERVNASGAIKWTENGVSPNAAIAADYLPKIITDASGGAISVWRSHRGGPATDLHAQRMNGSGAVQWTGGGKAVRAQIGAQIDPAVVSDGANGAIFLWFEYIGWYDIYAQRVKSTGTSEWTTDAVPIYSTSTPPYSPAAVSDGAGGAIVAWQDHHGSGIYNIYSQRIDALGAVKWPVSGVQLCRNGTWWAQSSPHLVSDGVGGAIVAWQDYRGGNGADIYVQRVNASGDVLWSADAVALCTAAGNQLSPRIISDGAGGAIATWCDYRDGANADIYAQRVDPSGAVQWTANGVAVCATSWNQGSAQIVSDGAGGAVIAWLNGPAGGSYIYAQRVSAAGAVQWAADGVLLCTSTWGQQNPQMTSDGAGGAIVAFQFNHYNGNYDIYAQRVNAAGAVQWGADGIALCSATGNQLYPAIAPDGAGGAIVVWQDERCGPQAYAQRVRASGEIVGTLLQSSTAALEGSSIRIGWTLSEIDEDARFSISRASAPEWEYVELEGAAIDQTGLSFTFIDETCLPGSTYKYRVECEVGGIGRRVLFETEAVSMPALPVTLYQNHPNPFNPQTVIRFYLPEAQKIILDVYDVAGERVARLAEGQREEGYHTVTWDGRNGLGAVCSSGVYFSRLAAGKNVLSRKMIIMR